MFLINLVYLFHIVFHCILLFVSVAHRDLTVYALINMALLLLLLLLLCDGHLSVNSRHCLFVVDISSGPLISQTLKHRVCAYI